MPLDGSVIAALQSELAPFVVSSRIEKIYQPEADELIITFRQQRTSMKLLLSAHNQYPRVQITEAVKQNPAQPPVFCMLLRKYLAGGRITKIEQPYFERMLVFHVQGTDELNQETHSQLIIEMMGKHSNIILVDADTNVILDSIKRIPLHISRKRQVLPGLTFEMPPSEKLNPLDDLAQKDFFALMESEPHTKVMRLLMNAFNGISPLVAVEICHRADLDSETEWDLMKPGEKERLAASFQQIISLVKGAHFSPNIYFNSETGQFVDFSVIPLTHLTTLDTLPAKSVSSMLETFYGQKDHQNRLHQRSQDLRKNLTLKKNRMSHKLQNLYHDEEKANRSLQDKVKADLIMANLHLIPIGESTFEAVNYYDEAQSAISIHWMSEKHLHLMPSITIKDIARQKQLWLK
jgi:predicted ribosome quality control (RQC) complex YloA/Tae2 family protein